MPLEKLDMDALDEIRELNYETKKAILDHIRKYRNNDIVFNLRESHEGYYVIFIFTDGSDYSVEKIDPYSVLNRLDCALYNSPDCKPITLPWQEAGFFFVISKESGENFIKHYDQPLLEWSPHALAFIIGVILAVILAKKLLKKYSYSKDEEVE